MDKKLEEIFAEQEKEDAYRITEGLEASINRELGDPAYLIETMKRDGLRGITEAYDFSIREAIVRVSAEFSIRKHTTCLVPYYHSHDFYEMIYVWKGTCRQRIAGEAQELILSEGNLCILPPGTVHAILPCSETDLILKIIIPNPMMKQITDELEQEKSSQESITEYLKVKNKIYIFAKTSLVSYSIKSYMYDLLHEAYRGTALQRPAVKCLVELLLITLGRSIPEQSNENLLQKVSAYIQKNIRNANLEEAAKLLGYSSRQLRRKITELSGGTFTDILWKTRMERAAELLNESDIQVEEIARTVGYQSTAGFYKRFCAVFHMTPAAYRKIYARPHE